MLQLNMLMGLSTLTTNAEPTSVKLEQFLWKTGFAFTHIHSVDDQQLEQTYYFTVNKQGWSEVGVDFISHWA